MTSSPGAIVAGASCGALAVISRVGFPHLVRLRACGRPMSSLDARGGVGWARMVFALPAAGTVQRAGQLTVRDYLPTFRRPLGHATLAGDDPVPGALDTVLLGWKAASRQRLGHAG
jgi:predicted ATP-grasp superfamily ATP-dependent carboligase